MALRFLPPVQLSLLFLLKERLVSKQFGSVGGTLTFREELETRKLFGSVVNPPSPTHPPPPTSGEEPMLTELLWASFGLCVAVAFDIFE